MLPPSASSYPSCGCLAESAYGQRIPTGQRGNARFKFGEVIRHRFVLSGTCPVEQKATSVSFGDLQVASNVLDDEDRQLVVCTELLFLRFTRPGLQVRHPEASVLRSDMHRAVGQLNLVAWCRGQPKVAVSRDRPNLVREGPPAYLLSARRPAASIPPFRVVNASTYFAVSRKTSSSARFPCSSSTTTRPSPSCWSNSQSTRRSSRSSV